MNPRTTAPNVTRRGRARPGAVRRRAVASVLAMMFLVIFGSLAAAMAVVAQGNLRTADSALRVSAAHSAAETGIVFGIRRLEESAKRFIVEKGVLDADFAHDLWLGSYDEGSDGAVTIEDPDWPAGYAEDSAPTSIAEAVRNAHLAEQTHDPTHTFCLPGQESLPAIDGFGTLLTCPIALTEEEDGSPNPEGPYFQLRYELVASAPYVRLTSVGVDGEIARTLQIDVRLDKKIEYAMLAPSRIMIGKNVRIEGPLGTRYGTEPGELDSANGDPLVKRSDFYYLDEDPDTGLNPKLDALYGLIPTNDVDGDARLRVNHTTENQGLADPLLDFDGDEYVDDWDLFMAHYDLNPADGMVVWNQALAQAAGLSPSLEVEFDKDLQLAHLMDAANPDRDGDGVVTPCDGVGPGTDCGLGYLDGVIDANDLYAKVRGRLRFGVLRSEWEDAHGASYQTIVHGPIHPGPEQPPVEFGVPAEDLRLITTDMVLNAQAWYDAQASGDFASQAGAPGGPVLESTPYNAKGAYDYYSRPLYQNKTFDNVRIPAGTNALFQNCIFKGVTFIETEADCTDIDWNYAGAQECYEDLPDNPGTWICTPKYPNIDAFVPSTNQDETDTKPFSNNIRFHDCIFVGSLSGTIPLGYAHWRNKVQFTGSTRFYLFADDPDLQQENPIVRAVIIAAINALNGVPGLVDELKKSSILLPGWSCDMGNFTNEQNGVVKLKGTIIAGILDLRGSVILEGTLLMTYRPVAGEGPLAHGGLTDAFNATIGYFGPSDGDGEGMDYDDEDFNGFGEIVIKYDPEAVSPDGIPWPVKAWADSLTYIEGAAP